VCKLRALCEPSRASRLSTESGLPALGGALLRVAELRRSGGLREVGRWLRELACGGELMGRRRGLLIGVGEVGGLAECRPDDRRTLVRWRSVGGSCTCAGGEEVVRECVGGWADDRNRRRADTRGRECGRESERRERARSVLECGRVGGADGCGRGCATQLLRVVRARRALEREKLRHRTRVRRRGKYQSRRRGQRRWRASQGRKCDSDGRRRCYWKRRERAWEGRPRALGHISSEKPTRQREKREGEREKEREGERERERASLKQEVGRGVQQQTESSSRTKKKKSRKTTKTTATLVEVGR
jgi:hypothetical protein